MAFAAAFVWFIAASLAAGRDPSPWGAAALTAYLLVGILHLCVIGTRLHRPWLKYAISAADILGICALMAFVPVSRSGEVPQIFAFRAYGIYYLFPLVALACLSLSWRLVAWAGLMVVVGWWLAFAWVVAGMEERVSWGDLPQAAPRAVYESIFLSPDFIGVGNRIEETAAVLIASLIMALAVYRARRVFFAQVAAEAKREEVAAILGRYVPEAIATRLISDAAAMAPQLRHGVVLIMDIQGFTAFAATRTPEEVITALNGFLAACAETIGAHGGVVISFTGDGLLATFNTPLTIERPEAAALTAARALKETAGGSGFAIRIGVAAGDLAAGSVGSTKRQAFTVYGDTVNRAARLEALAKELGETLLVDETVAVDGELRHLGRYELRGMEEVAVWAG